MAQLLIVDDEIHAIQGIKEAIDWNKLGISSVFAANNIRQAREIFAYQAIDITLCDIEMPQGSGLDLLCWIKENYPRTETVFLTCHADFNYAKQALKLGSLDYILKPIPYLELEAVLVKALDKIKADSELVEYSEYGRLWMRRKSLMDDSSQSVTDRVKAYITAHIDQDLSLMIIADHVHLNPDYLTRIFKKESGMTVMEYHSRERIKIAQELLAKSDLSVSEVAAKLSYTNFSYFSKIFRKYTNMSPASYKQNCRDKQQESE